MYRGTTKQIAKVWITIGGSQISEIPAGATVTGSAPASSGYAYINAGTFAGKTWKAGYTRTLWLSMYQPVDVTPPPPPPPTVTLKHTIEVYSDGSIKVDGIAIP